MQYNIKSKSTANDVRSPKSICKNEMSKNLGCSDFNVQTSVIPCLKYPDTNIAQTVSKINSIQIMYPIIAYESKNLSKRSKFDSFSDVCKISLNPLYVFVKFIFFLSFFLNLFLEAGFGSTEGAKYETKYNAWASLCTEFAPFKSLFLKFSVNYKHGLQFFKHNYKDEISLSVFYSREGRKFFKLRV